MENTKRKHPISYLKQWREFRGMSQKQLAERAGFTDAYITQLETGQRGLSFTRLQKLAPILETTPGAILDRPPDEFDADAVMHNLWTHSTQDERQRLAIIAEQIIPYQPEPRLESFDHPVASQVHPKDHADQDREQP